MSHMRKQWHLGVISTLFDSKWHAVLWYALDRTIAFHIPCLNQNRFLLAAVIQWQGLSLHSGLTDPALWLLSCLSWASSVQVAYGHEPYLFHKQSHPFCVCSVSQMHSFQFLSQEYSVNPYLYLCLDVATHLACIWKRPSATSILFLH